MKIATTTLSSKGQIVIPQSMRTNIEPGTQFLIFQENDSITLKKSTNLQAQEDLEFEKRTREALKEYDKGNFISMDGEEFLKELEKW